ncbi:hypothetical protein RFI_19147 [Reticulomyxa filosa]|uniref:Uncharacterized protein n=1 Tax=Reticulomyxa filosa TaxID=46433 RepID=X6MWX3_RETFI|nr:hypothetical protein RFI_19147 [Reticulomyxa filosa]|eukprot:ETO18141.1 hypothetical protein RFI_19147 [Reticulomyxa filosa]
MLYLLCSQLSVKKFDFNRESNSQFFDTLKKKIISRNVFVESISTLFLKFTSPILIYKNIMSVNLNSNGNIAVGVAVVTTVAVSQWIKSGYDSYNFHKKFEPSGVLAPVRTLPDLFFYQCFIKIYRRSGEVMSLRPTKDKKANASGTSKLKPKSKWDQKASSTLKTKTRNESKSNELEYPFSSKKAQPFERSYNSNNVYMDHCFFLFLFCFFNDLFCVLSKMQKGFKKKKKKGGEVISYELFFIKPIQKKKKFKI